MYQTVNVMVSKPKPIQITLSEGVKQSYPQEKEHMVDNARSLNTEHWTADDAKLKARNEQQSNNGLA